MGEPSARRGIRNANHVLAGRTLDLPACEMRLALQSLVAVATVEFEFSGSPAVIVCAVIKLQGQEGMN
jgi:hypothetical protein